ncbi:hypothetical protein [Caballeronia fortuita]|uniref:hypothetical protein n=1 Tax=Caballeronia fortuita TaxID=1777138 RepID=UPI000AFA98B5|nr:hypothetical protein [Caballeronia fortuita]
MNLTSIRLRENQRVFETGSSLETLRAANVADFDHEKSSFVHQGDVALHRADHGAPAIRLFNSFCVRVHHNPRIAFSFCFQAPVLIRALF